MMLAHRIFQECLRLGIFAVGRAADKNPDHNFHLVKVSATLKRGKQPMVLTIEQLIMSIPSSRNFGAAFSIHCFQPRKVLWFGLFSRPSWRPCQCSLLSIMQPSKPSSAMPLTDNCAIQLTTWKPEPWPLPTTPHSSSSKCWMYCPGRLSRNLMRFSSGQLIAACGSCVTFSPLKSLTAAWRISHHSLSQE